MNTVLNFPASIEFQTSSDGDFLITDGKIFDEKHINKIAEDNNSGDYITSSIPNPLATIYSYRNAFQHFVQEYDEQRGHDFSGPYAQMVSDILDFLQWTFERTDTNDMEIESWNLDRLSKISQVEGDDYSSKQLRHFAETLYSYFKNIENFNNLTFIFYKKDDIKILMGATSPYTMLYLSPNAKRLLKDIKLEADDGDVYFDKDIRRLNERSVQFKNYLFDLASKIDKDDKQFLPFKQYIDYELKGYSYNKQEYVPLFFGSSALYSSKLQFFSRPLIDNLDSNLKIKSDLSTWNQNHGGIRNPIFINENDLNGKYLGQTNLSDISKNGWISESDNNDNIWKRKIPGKNIEYPWVNTDDFFYPILIKVEGGELNGNDFILGENNNNYLLPLTELYFQFFSIDEINNRLSFKLMGNEIVVSLVVPIISQDSLIVSKRYDISCGEEKKIPLALFVTPNIKNTPNDVFEVLTIIGQKKDKGFIKFYNQKSINAINFGDSSQENNTTNLSSSTHSTTFSKFNFTVCEQFDYLIAEINADNEELLRFSIVPRFEDYGSKTNVKAEIAIDFGTSNTFIATKIGTNAITPFGISSYTLSSYKIEGTNKTLYEIFNGDTDIFNEFRKYLLPLKFSNSEFIEDQKENIPSKVPFRTILLKGKEGNKIFHDVSIAFYYDYLDSLKLGETFQTNIKPKLEKNSNESYKLMVKGFLKELLFAIKILLDKQRISYDNLNLYYTYPSTYDFKTNLRKIYNELAEDTKLFKKSNIQQNIIKVYDISESEAPFMYLMNKKINGDWIFPGGPKKGSINVDIGGGTTDVAIMANHNTINISSFGFAGNHLWGGNFNKFGEEEKDNLFINIWKYQSEALLENDTFEIKKFKFIEEPDNSVASDLSNYLFSKNEKLQFTNIFNNFENGPVPLYLKSIALLHFSCILYYVIRLSEKNNNNHIHSLTFTGKGSLYLSNILFKNDQDLKKFINLFLEKYNIINKSSITITDNILSISNPKEVTAYGVLSGTSQKLVPNVINYPNIEEKNIKDDDGLVIWDIETKEINILDEDGVIMQDICNLFNTYYNTLFDLKIFSSREELVKYRSMLDEKYVKTEWNRACMNKTHYSNDSSFFLPCHHFLHDFASKVENYLNKNFYPKY